MQLGKDSVAIGKAYDFSVDKIRSLNGYDIVRRLKGVLRDISTVTKALVLMTCSCDNFSEFDKKIRHSLLMLKGASILQKRIRKR